jgi:nicotinate-nucleotide adenylyltransferase
MRVALFGGTFDPIHRGHLAIAGAAADAFALDKVLFAPVGRQPLKGGGTPTGFGDRLAMVRLACEGDGRFVASEVDAPRGDWTPNYTVDTLQTLRWEMPDATLFVLVGADSFLICRGGVSRSGWWSWLNGLSLAARGFRCLSHRCRSGFMC